MENATMFDGIILPGKNMEKYPWRYVSFLEDFFLSVGFVTCCRCQLSVTSSPEQWKKEWLVRLHWGWNYPVIFRDHFINHENPGSRILMNQPGFNRNWGFFSAHLFIIWGFKFGTLLDRSPSDPLPGCGWVLVVDGVGVWGVGFSLSRKKWAMKKRPLVL